MKFLDPPLSKTSNKYVSTAAVSRAEKLLITKLVVICEMGVERTNKSVVWQYFGRLYNDTDVQRRKGRKGGQR